MSSRDIMEATGSFGRWQKMIFIVFFYISFVGIWQNLAIAFFAPNMDFRCISSSNNSSLHDQCHVTEGNRTIPCTEWEYDTSYFSHTIVSEWDLVCDREWLVSLAKSVYMVGFLLSVIIFGQISDWVGRYPVIVMAYIITVASMFLSLLSTSYLMFVILRFFQAFGRTGLTTTGFVLLMEVVGEKHRTNVGIGVQLGWALGFVTLPLVAFLFRHWFWLQVALSIPILPIAFSYSIVPESPRWLLMRGNVDRLEKLLKKASKINGKEFKLEKKDFEVLRTQVSEKTTKSALDLFKTPRLRSRTLNMIYLWIVNAFMYYGFSFNTNDLAGNPYINFMVAGALEFPSYAVVYWGVKILGRRPTLVGLMLLGGAACAAIAVAPENLPWISTSLAMAGKFCITGSFGLLYLYTSELFPTVVRNVAIGSCSMCARVGSILAPFVKELGKSTYSWLPNVVYAFLAISSGLLALLLPETKGRQIPDTLEEGEQFAQSSSPYDENSIAMQECNSVHNILRVK